MKLIDVRYKLITKDCLKKQRIVPENVVNLEQLKGKHFNIYYFPYTKIKVRDYD